MPDRHATDRSSPESPIGTPPTRCTVHFAGGPWAGQTAEVERVVGPLFAVGDPIGNHYWLDTKSDPPTYVWDGSDYEQGPVFETLPSGLDIAHWFRDEEFAGRFQNVGGDATWLCREPHGWLHHLATVDHDDQMFYLLAIGTGDTQDMLFVTAGLRCDLACEWRNEPTAKQDWGYAPLVWLAGMVEQYEADWAAVNIGDAEASSATRVEAGQDFPTPGEQP